jgi:aldehyde:ferredoxin oxidoreductase
MYGKIIRVNLTNEKITTELIPEEWQQKYVGGEGINDRLLWEHFLTVSPHIDPLGPDNVLIGGIGPLAGTGALGAGSKMKWTFKSPAYNIFGDSVGCGFFGSQLRYAGYDYIVITGKAKRPVYITIDDDDIQIRNAEKIWGTDAHEADTRIREDVGIAEMQTALIGQAGENLVRFASLVISRNRIAARTGGGCVMGSKNLKGIAVRGTKGVKIADPARFIQVTQKAYSRMDLTPTWNLLAKVGTTFLVRDYNLIGGQPWRNHQSNVLPEDITAALDSEFFLRHFKVRDYSCAPGCATACSNWWRIKGQETPYAATMIGRNGEKPDYGFIASCLCWGVTDFAEILHLQHEWDRYGVDSFEMGESIGFLMDMFERGVITEDDIMEWTGKRTKLLWGDIETVDFITESVVKKKNKLYDIVRGGVYQTACMIEKLKGGPVTQYANYGGKHSTEIEDIRSRPTWTLLMATSTRGADHLKALSTIEMMGLANVARSVFGSEEAANSDNPYLVGCVSAWEENRTTAMNCSGLCIFNTATFTYTGPDTELVREALIAVTGRDPGDLLMVGERVYNLEKAFNSRLHMTREHDTLCEAWMNEPIPEGKPGAGKKAADHLDMWLDEYYDYRGWDRKNGLQTVDCLRGLGLEDIADVLLKEGVVSREKPVTRDKVVKDRVQKAEEFKKKRMA